MNTNTTVQDAWINRLNKVYRRDRLVFAEVLKNASTWASAMLAHNGFVSSEVADIEWDRDHVFGFIQEPFKRRLKGIAEDLITSYSVEQYLLNNLGRKFWVDHLVFGIHSIPLSLTWHDRIYQIDWIPIDYPDLDLDQMLAKLFLVHDMEYRKLPHDHIHKHKSDPYKNEIFERIKHMIGEGNGNLQLMLAKDIDFYNTVMKNFDPAPSNQWRNISWLKNCEPAVNKHYRA